MRLHRSPSEKATLRRDIPRDIRLRQPVRRILRCLERFETVGTTTYNLQRETGLSRPTLMRYLALLLKEDVIKRPLHGIYVYVRDETDITADPDAQYGVHGIVLTAFGETNPLLRAVADRLRTRPDARPYETDRWVSIYESWRSRVVELRVYKTGTVNVYVPCTRNPLRWEEVSELAGWLTAILSPVDVDRVWVVQIGVHADHRGYTMKACKALQFLPWRNGFQQWYEKTRDRFRREIHLHHRPGVISLAQAATIMAEGSPENKRLKAEQIALRQLELEHAQERERMRVELETERMKLETEKLRAENLKIEEARKGPAQPSSDRPSDMYG